MRRALALAVFFFLAAFTARAASPHGAWHLTQREDGRMQIEMISDHNQNSHSIERSAFTGLTAAQIDANADTPVDFRMIKDAGTVHFTGMFQHGDGVGRFTFEPNPAYAATLRSLGVAAGDLDDERLFSLAIHDVSSNFIKEMQSLGYREDLDQYVAFRIHGATPEYVREINALGYRPDGGDLVAFRIHGATASYIRDLKNAGFANIPVEKLVEMKIYGIDAEYVKRTK